MKRVPGKKPARPAKAPAVREIPRRLHPNPRLAAQKRRQLAKHYVNRYGVGSR